MSTATKGTAVTYSYDTRWSDKLVSYNGQSIVYDSIGNPTTYRGATLTWNGRLLTSYEKGSDRYEYSYNEDGLRVEKKYYSNNTLNDICTYVWENGKLIAQKKYVCQNDDYLTITYLYDGEEAIGFVYDGLTFYYIKNIQGDVTAIAIADSGKLALTISYDAWGTPSYSIVVDDNAGVWEKLVAFLRAAGIMGLNNYTYRGYFYDLEIGLYYLQSRYYDPEVGRFINLDETSIAVATAGEILATNLFAYCCNNPVCFLDSNGEKGKNTNPSIIAIVEVVMIIAIEEKYKSNFSVASHNKYKNKCAISINFNKNKFDVFLYGFYNEIGDKIFEVLTVYVLELFKSLKIREFLLSDECVENEIKEHYLGYMFYRGYKIKPPTKITAYYIAVGLLHSNNEKDMRIFYNSIIERCSAADIAEWDAVSESSSKITAMTNCREAVAFNYYNGIRSCYKYTNKDPYYRNGSRTKNYSNYAWLHSVNL